MAFLITLNRELMSRTAIIVTTFSYSSHEDVDLDTLPMPKLLAIFESHMNLHGRSQLVGIIRNTPVDEDGINGNSDHGDESEKESSEGDSDSFGTDSSDSSEEKDDNDESDNESVASGYMVVVANEEIRLHPRVDHHYRHCPPFETLEHTIFGACDCSEYGMIECCQLNNFSYFHKLEFDKEYDMALESVLDEDRVEANKLRKRLYKMIFHETDIGILEKHERRKLPNCAVARVRQIYPCTEGLYMGFKET